MKSKHSLFTLTAFLLLFLLSPVTAQKDVIFDQIRNQDYSLSWEPYFEDDNIRISVRYSDCSDPANGIYPEFLLFRVENKTGSGIHTYWKWSFDYNGVTRSKNNTDEELVKITLKAYESIEGSCTGSTQVKLRLFVQDKMNGKSASLTDFSLTDYHVFEL